MSRPPILLIGWAAADWKLLHPLLDAGEMPHLHALLSRGTMGALTAPSPLVPEILWTSLATGRRATGHGILAPRRNETENGSPLLGRNCPAFWDLLKRAGLRTHLINWPLTDPVEATGGVCVSDKFFALARGSKSADASRLVSPPEMALPLGRLRVDPAEVDDESIRFFVPKLDRVPREYDDRPARVARAIARALSVQAVATWLLENRTWDVAALRFDLLADLASWALPLMPPKLGAVGPLEFDLYRDVLSAACRTLDLLLGTLVRLARPEAVLALVSDHGLLSGHARPVRFPRELKGAESWRRSEGIIVLSGAPCRADEVIFGAKLLDVVPTLLALRGISAPLECEGRILAEAFHESPSFPPGPLATDWPRCSDPPSPPALEADDSDIQSAWNLALSHLDARQVAPASILLEALHAARPDRLEFLSALFECHLALRRLEPAREVLASLLDRLWPTPQAALLQARLEYAARRFDLSLHHLEQIESADNPLPRVHLQIGLNLIKLNHSARARSFFERELEIQPESAEARAGLAYCCLRAGEFERTIAHALEAIALNYQLHHAHFLLGLAQARQGEPLRAVAAFRLVTALVPEFAPAHRCLSIIYGQDPAHAQLAQRHKELARSARSWSWGF